MSERQLSKSYSSLQKWKIGKGAKEWTRWDFAKQKEKWLENNKLTEQWLYENLEWMIESGKIASVQKADEDRLYYIVTTQKGEEYYLVFEQTRGINAMVLIFENHWQNYCFNTVLRTLTFDFEVYDCFQNSIEDILFSHCQSKDAVYINTTIVGGKIDLNFSLNRDLPVWKVVNDYHSLFEEISKYNLNCIEPFDEKSQIENVVKIANMFRKRKSEEITRFRVTFDGYGSNKEWFDVAPNGISIKARICDGGNYVICHKDGSTERLDYFITHQKSYRIKDGAIVDRENKKITNQKLAKTIISDIREAKRLFYRVKQDFWAD